MSEKEQKITFNKAHWRIPSVKHAFDGVLEGKPTDQKKKEIIEKTERERVDWSPSKEAWEQFELVKNIIAHEIVVQMWDPIMFMLDDEGPYPMQAFCTGLHLILNEDGKPQAYLSLKNVSNIKTPDGYDGRSRFLNLRREVESLLSLADIYEINCGGKENQLLIKNDAIKSGLTTETAEIIYPCNGIAIKNPDNFVTARYNRTFSESQMDKILGVGIPKLVDKILSLTPECKHNEYAFDIHQRENSKLMVYHGGTHILTMDFSKIESGTIHFISECHGNGRGCDEEYNKIKHLTKVDDSNIDEITNLVCTFLLKVVTIVNPDYYGNLKEGYWSSKLSIDYGRNWRPDMEWLIIDREAVLGFDNQPQKDAFYESYKKNAQLIKDEFQNKRPKEFGKETLTNDFGDELDCLAIGLNKELVCIELKHGSNVSGIYWGPLQASVYCDAFSAQLDSISESIKTMVQQKIRLGLLPTEAKKRLPDGNFKVIQGFLAVAGDINKKSGCWKKAKEVNGCLNRPYGSVKMVCTTGDLLWENFP